MIRSIMVVALFAVSSVAVAPQAEAGLFGCFKKKSCCEPAPVCCEAPEPVCCEPAPAPVVCCEPAPAPVCCEPCAKPKCGLFAKIKARFAAKKCCPDPCCN